MLFWTRKRIQGMMAASLYEALSDRDQRALDAALRNDPGLRAEYEALRAVVGAVPVTAIDGPDVLPLVRSRLDAQAVSRPMWKPAISFAAVVLIGGVAWGSFYFSGLDTPARTVTPSRTADTLVGIALEEADRLLAMRDTAGAYETLRKAVERRPTDAQAGEAQWRVASLAFELRRYPEAYEAYSTLREKYWDTIQAAEPERRKRANEQYQALAEAKSKDFEPLYAFDVAMADRGNTFQALEDVIARFPTQHTVTDWAAFEMAKLVSEDLGGAPTTEAVLAAYETARDRCSAPIAVAQLNLKIGDVYRDTLADFALAEDYYLRAAANPELAARANSALARLAQLRQ